MFLSVNLWNHGITGALSTHDITDGIVYPLHELGVQSFCCREAFLLPPYVNMIYENFVDAWQVEVMREARRRGCRFMMVVTEMPEKLGFNGGKRMGLKERMTNFPEILKLVDVVVCLCPGAAQKIREWFKHPACVDAELGYSETFQKMIAQRIAHVRTAERLKPKYDPRTETKWIDFAFYGPLTQHRLDVLHALKRKGFAVSGEGWVPPQDERDLLLVQAKVGLNLKADTWTQPVSSSRLLRIVQLGLPALSEPVNGASIWKDKKIARFAAKHSSFVDEAIDTLSNAADIAAEQMRLLKKYLHPEAALGHVARLMRETMPELTHVNGGIPEMKFIQVMDAPPQVGALSIAA